MYKELFELSGKRALVIGGASGIGKAIADGFKEFGAYVIVADLKASDVKGLYDEVYYVDITDYRSVEDLFKKVGNIDILVSTPGINIRKKIKDYTLEEFDKILRVNLIGQFYVAKNAVKYVNKGGSIIFIASIRAVVVEPGQGPYSMTKAGIVQMVKTLASELGKYNIRVNAIAPGVVDTPLTRQIKEDPKWYDAYASKTALGRWAEAWEIVGPAILLASKAGSYITGSVIFVDGGWTSIDGRFDPFAPD